MDSFQSGSARSSEFGADIHIEGIEELKAAYKRVPRTIKASIRKRLIAVGRIVTGEAKTVARSKGLVGNGDHRDGQTGTLVESIKPSVRANGTQVAIVAGAKRLTSHPGVRGRTDRVPNPYNYPKVYEYGGAKFRMGGGGRKGNGRRTLVDMSMHGRSDFARSRGLVSQSNGFTGARAFMAPALANKGNEAALELGKALIDVEREFYA